MCLNSYHEAMKIQPPKTNLGYLCENQPLKGYFIYFKVELCVG